VTVKVPAALTVIVAVVWLPLLHNRVEPADEVAVRVAEVLILSMRFSSDLLIVGLTVSIVTTTTSEAVHPLAPVAVTVNVPAAFTVMEAVVWLPLLHNKVEPADEVDVRVADVLIQLMT